MEGGVYAAENHQMAVFASEGRGRAVDPGRLAPPHLNDKCRTLSYFKKGKYHWCKSQPSIQPKHHFIPFVYLQLKTTHKLFILTLDAIFLYSQSSLTLSSSG